MAGLQALQQGGGGSSAAASAEHAALLSEATELKKQVRASCLSPLVAFSCLATSNAAVLFISPGARTDEQGGRARVRACL